MAPSISVVKGKSFELKNVDKYFKQEKDQLIKIREFIEKNFEYVGKDFSKRVREIYYDKTSKKTIYGTTTPEERKDLSEEGIDLLSVPWVNKDN